ncbi:MAG: DMT family transporter [Sulfurimicrobium sp.]|jgi:drug/metabolite transporter (DMT)-like permease|nr:DMT family transporter [Sulfurimicrobium sp.]MDZ7655563.1 DMT family transporter [Sulfurimicrobium sp.]
MTSSWMIVAGILFSIMGVFVKLGSEYFSSAELVFYRSLFGLLVIYLIIKLQGLSLATPHLKMHFWRGFSGFVALMLFFYAISALPLATAITLNYTSPLFLALLTTVMLREGPRPLLIFTIILGFAGVVLLLRPTLHAEQLIAGLLGLLSGFFAGIAYLNVKQLGAMGEPEWRVVFYFTLFSTLGGGIWMLFHTFHAMTLHRFAILLAIGTTATLAQLAMTRAYRTGNALVVGSLAYSTVIFASLWGVLLWQEILPLGSWLAIGLIVLSGVISLRTTPRLPVI